MQGSSELKARFGKYRAKLIAVSGCHISTGRVGSGWVRPSRVKFLRIAAGRKL